MRPGRVLGVVWVLLSATACPHAFGKGGTIDRAVLKVMDESSIPPRVADCSPATLRRMCLPEKFEECARQCEQVLEQQTLEDEG